MKKRLCLQTRFLKKEEEKNNSIQPYTFEHAPSMQFMYPIVCTRMPRLVLTQAIGSGLCSSVLCYSCDGCRAQVLPFIR